MEGSFHKKSNLMACGERSKTKSGFSNTRRGLLKSRSGDGLISLFTFTDLLCDWHGLFILGRALSAFCGRGGLALERILLAYQSETIRLLNGDLHCLNKVGASVSRSMRKCLMSLLEFKVHGLIMMVFRLS